jgi:galacturonosyltransferase
LEAVENGVSGFLCEKQNADDLYNTMKKFTLLSYDERKQMGLAGRNRMERIFDKQKVVEKTISRL